MSNSVPFWGELPSYVQDSLASRDYDHRWFDEHQDTIRLTVLNLYVKLSGLDLWKFVTKRDPTAVDPKHPNVGNLQFLTADVNLLRAALRNRSATFTAPDESLKDWQCRETRGTGALHFKHFSGWTEPNRVQAHIDRIGLYAGHVPISVVAYGLPHLIDLCRHGWENVFAIRDLLLQQGWDRQPLLGTGAK